MSFSRRQFLDTLAVATALAAFGVPVRQALASPDALLDPPAFGNLSLLQIGDTQAHLEPVYYREAAQNVGLGKEASRPPFLTGEFLLEHYRVVPQSLRAYALTPQNFINLAERYGPLGGYAVLATALRMLRVARQDSLLLSTGNCLLGSGLAGRTGGAEMVAATRLLGVDAMTCGAELTLGRERLNEIFGQALHGQTAFVAGNARGAGGRGQPFVSHAIYFVSGVPVGVVGQASHHARHRSAAGDAEWGFQVDEQRLQAAVDSARAAGARVIVLLSQAGIAVDIRLASRVRGIDVVFSGQTVDPLPEPMVIRNGSGRTLLASVGACGKFCAVLDLDVRAGRVADYRYRLIPMVANLLREDPEMAALIRRHRLPHGAWLDEALASNQSLLYRRGNFASTTDQLILEALLAGTQSDVAFVPGYRWGPTLLPGQPVTRGWLLAQLSCGGPDVLIESLHGDQLRQRLEDGLEGVFHNDPYARSGEDVVRVGGLVYACDLSRPAGRRVGEVSVRGQPLRPQGLYRTASWGSAIGDKATSVAIVPLVEDYLRQLAHVLPVEPAKHIVRGVAGNRGWFG